MKLCGKCKESKQLEAFAIRDKRTGLRQNVCRDCKAEYKDRKSVV